MDQRVLKLINVRYKVHLKVQTTIIHMLPNQTYSNYEDERIYLIKLISNLNLKKPIKHRKSHI